MARIVYKPLSSLAPIELNYRYNNNEPLKKTYNIYQTGINVDSLFCTKNYQDVTINNYSCFVLTKDLDINSVFNPGSRLNFSQLPNAIILQPRGSAAYFIKHNPIKNTLQATLTSASTFLIKPIRNTDTVELLIENKYLQVDANYPYLVTLNETPLPTKEINRQRFNVLQQNDIITFKTKTKDGYRYLALNTDNVLRATGLVLNDSIVNDYVFHSIFVSTPNLSSGFIPSNDWVTYYYDIENKTNNKNLQIKKQIKDITTNYLLDFPYENIDTTNSVTLNIANLKTNLTPTGGPGALIPATGQVIVEERIEEFSIVFEETEITGYLYIPKTANSVDVVLGFHGTTESDSQNIATANSLLTRLKDIVGIKDKAIVTVAYPQEDILFGDNVYYAETVLKWLFSNPTELFEIDIDKIYLFGHSQGGYIVTRLNTMHKTDGVISSAPGPINLVDRCLKDEAQTVRTSRECQLLYSVYGSANTNPQAYYERSLLNFASNQLAKTLYIQGLSDTPYQLERFEEFEAALKNCTDCAPYAILKIPEGGHGAYAETPEGRRAIISFLDNTLEFPEPVIDTPLPLLYTFSNFETFITKPTTQSTSQTFVVSGENIQQDLNITVSDNYEISFNNINFTSSLALTPTNNIIELTTLYVRLKGGLVAGSYNGAITLASISVNRLLGLTGLVVVPLLTLNGGFNNFLTTEGTVSPSQAFTVAGNNLLQNVVITPPTGYEISTNNTSFVNTITLIPQNRTLNTTVLYIRLKNNITPGNYNGNITITSDDIIRTAAVTGTVTTVIIQPDPILNIVSNLIQFSATEGSNSVAQSFTVSGQNLTQDITITPPNGYEVSTNNSTYTTTVTLTRSGQTVNTTTIFIRLKNNITPGNYNGNITITSGSVNQTLSVIGTVQAVIVNPPPPPPPSGILFDKARTAAALNLNDPVQAEIKPLLEQAADIWNQYIELSPNIISDIQNNNSNSTLSSPDSQFNGIYLKPGQLTFIDDPGKAVARCGATDWKIYPSTNGDYDKILTISYLLEINLHYYNRYKNPSDVPYGSFNYVDLLVHELGHALGIGIWWGKSFMQYLNNNFGTNFTYGEFSLLNGTGQFSGTSQTYNTITGLNRQSIPLESTGGGGSAGYHWEDEFRSRFDSANNQEYYGIVNETMRSSVYLNPILSRLSITAVSEMGPYTVKDYGTINGLIIDDGTSSPAIGALTEESKPHMCGVCSNSQQHKEYINTLIASASSIIIANNTKQTALEDLNQNTNIEEPQ